MFIDFFNLLRAAKVPVTIREYLVLLEAMDKGVAGYSVDEFYHLARTVLVKDEKHFDKFDQAFAVFFKGAMAKTEGLLGAELPADWLKKMLDRVFTDEEKAAMKALSFDELMDQLAKRLAEQKGRHQGGSKWIGTGGASPYGNSGYNPAGVRIGGEGGGGAATKVWEKREFRGLDSNVEIGTRNIKMALRRLRKFVREGAQDEFDLPGTIRATADNAGWLDIKMVAERKNRVKVLLFFDVGGSMDSFVRISEELFSAARSELKHLEYFYFHNFLYERVWRENKRGYNEFIETAQVLNTYGPDYKVVFVGDATMSPYEITEVGGSIEHWNPEAGEVWMRRMTDTFPDIVWINPVAEARWMATPSVRIVHQIVGSRMFPMTLEGLDRAMTLLRKRAAMPLRVR